MALGTGSVTRTDDTRPVYGPKASRRAILQWALFERITQGTFGEIRQQVRNPSMIAKGLTGPGWYIRSNQTPISQQGGAGGHGSGSASSAGGNAANALVKQQQFNRGIDTGATDIRGAGVAVAGEFMGVNLFAIDTKLPPNMAEDAQNVDGIRHTGGLSPRVGLIAMYPRRNQSLNSTAAIPDAYEGRAINALSPDFEQSGQPTFIASYDKVLNSTLSLDANRPNSVAFVNVALPSTLITISRYGKPHWNPQHPIENVAPEISAKTNSGGVVSLAVAMPSRFQRSLPVVASVDRLVVRRHHSTFPRDIDGQDDLGSLVTLKDYSDFDGTSTLVADAAASGFSTGVTLYYAAWAVSKEQVSKRALYKLELA